MAQTSLTFEADILMNKRLQKACWTWMQISRFTGRSWPPMAGRSIGIVDLTRRLTISYAINRMGTGVAGTDRTEAYVREVYCAMAGMDARV